MKTPLWAVIGGRTATPATVIRTDQARQQSPAKAPPALKLSIPFPRSNWPLWAAQLASQAQPGDGGLGDVVARFVAGKDGVAFRAAFTAMTGQACGCNFGRDYLNSRYALAG